MLGTTQPHNKHQPPPDPPGPSVSFGLGRTECFLPSCASALALDEKGGDNFRAAPGGQSSAAVKSQARRDAGVWALSVTLTPR